jgi:hypothetical protein
MYVCIYIHIYVYIYIYIYTHTHIHISLYFNRAKLLTKIHDGEIKSQNYQVSDGFLLPSFPGQETEEQ